MARVNLYETLTDQRGNALTGTVVITNHVGGAAVSAYAAETGGVALTSPVALTNGTLDVWVAPGTYDLNFAATGQAVDKTVTIVDRANLPISVRDHGAVGDGVADDSAAITTADAAALAAGRTLAFPAGTYVAEGLTPTVSWHGDGATIRHKANSAVALMSLANGTADITISGFTIDGNVANQAGTPGQAIVVRGVRQTIRDCHVKDIAGDTNAGVHIFGDTANGTRGILVHGCTFENCRGYGIRMSGDGVEYPTDIIIANNRLLDCGLSGGSLSHSISISGVAKRVLVIGNTIKSQTTSGSGIEGYAAGIEDYQVIGNHVESVGHHGSHVGGTRVQVVGNTYRNINLRAIIVASDPNAAPTLSRDFLVANNVIEGTTSTTNGSGIEVQNFSGGAINGNTITNPATHGISLQGGAGTEVGNCEDISIAGNTVRWTSVVGTGSGIRAANIKRVTISGNTVRAAVSSGIIVQDDADGVVEDVAITGNVVTGCDRGIRTSATDINRVTVTGNVSNGNTTTDYDVQNKTDVVLTGNFSGASRTVASAAGMTLPEEHDYIVVSGTTTITSVTASYAGRVVTLMFSGILTFTDGSNLKLNGNFVTTADDTITIVCDGTNWFEVARSAN